MPTNKIPDLVATIAPVTAYIKKHFCSRATGFFYSDKYDGIEKTYFITNRHVVIGKEKKYYPEYLELRLHIDSDDPTKNINCKIDLYDERGEKKWLEHPENEDRSEEDKKIDVAIIEMTDDIMAEDSFFVAKFQSTNFLPEDAHLELGSDVIVVGYPYGMSDKLNNFPLIKTAHLASVYPGLFDGEPYFLIDGTLRVGMSGSPVILRPSPISTISGGVTIGEIPKIYLLGIHSASYRDAELHVVWFDKIIKEIIDFANKTKLN